jgi:hypothetical protein
MLPKVKKPPQAGEDPREELVQGLHQRKEGIDVSLIRTVLFDIVVYVKTGDREGFFQPQKKIFVL